jgi:hypothetical protein
MTDNTEGPRPRPATIAAAILVTVLTIAILVELLSSELLIYRYRRGGQIYDGSLSSAVALMMRVGSKLGLIGDPIRLELTCSPSPCLKVDPVFGWSANPGTFVYSYRRLRNEVWETFPVKITINPDQSRWTGIEANMGKPTIYVLGDSFVFGTGVNDEQTFAYHLQMAKPGYNIKLFALGGYSLVHSYLRIEQLKSQISDRDIIIVGYADYLDVRNVAAPSRLRAIDDWRRQRKILPDESKIPKAILNGDQLSIGLAEQDCRLIKDFCNSADPGTDDMRRIAIRLIHGIAQASKARTYLLHFDGSKNNPVVRDSGMETISALPEDFGYFTRDDIEGFDPHPGPYWHYAIANRLIAQIK